jgi:predicted dehydrogenase
MAGRVFHAPVISAVPRLRLAVVVERHGETARQRYPGVAVVKDAAELFGNKDIELAVIATPNATHFDLARAALLAGKHVVVDKPFTVASSDAQELVDLARKAGRILTVFQNRRWDGDFLTVSEMVRTGRLGRLVEFESSFDRFRAQRKPGAWKEQPGPGAGLLYDIGPHLVDQALALFGSPKSLAADIRIERDNAETDDQFEIVLHYPGLKVTLEAGMLACEPRPRFRLNGSNGSFVKCGLDPQEEALRQGASPAGADWGKEGAGQWGTLTTGEGTRLRCESVETAPGRYAAFYENVYDAIVNGAELCVKPERGGDVIRIIERALQSSREGRTVETDA